MRSSPSSPLFASRAHGESRRAWRPRPFLSVPARLGSARLPKPPAVVFSAPPRQPWCPTRVPSPGTRKTHRRSPVVEGGVFRGFRQRASRARRVRDACQSRKRRRARGERSRETPRASVMSAFSDPTRGGMLERRGRSSSRLAPGSRSARSHPRRTVNGLYFFAIASMSAIIFLLISSRSGTDFAGADESDDDARRVFDFS